MPSVYRITIQIANSPGSLGLYAKLVWVASIVIPAGTAGFFLHAVFGLPAVE